MDVQEMIERLVLCQPIEYKELPSISLYMDQVITFLEERLRSAVGEEEEKSPTKTMINHYTKLGILPPPEKKKYSREHLLLLILMWRMKPVMNISDIGIFTSQFLERLSLEEEQKTFYETFLKMEREMRTSLYAGIEQQFAQVKKDLGQQEGEAALMYALLLADHAAEEKRLAELILAELEKSSSQ